jgi:hypothetical protein
MPTPLIAKRPPALSPVENILMAIFIGGPLVALWYCSKQHQVIHFDNPRLNLGVHAALFVMPLIWVALIFRKPVVYEANDGETLLGTTTCFARWPVNWWMMFMLLATPVVAGVVSGHAFYTRYLPHPETLSTSPGKALVFLVAGLLLGKFYETLLLGRSEPAAWISDAGLRTGVLRFLEWKDIHHLSQHGDLYAFYHCVKPAWPASSFKVRDREAQAVLERYLSKHNIRVLNDPDPSLFIVKVAVVLGFLGNVAFSLWLRFNTSLSFLAVVLISFGLGIVMTIVLEKFRGVSKYGKHRPIIEPPDDGGIGDAPKPII